MHFRKTLTVSALGLGMLVGSFAVQAAPVTDPWRKPADTLPPSAAFATRCHSRGSHL